jgi:hypothetical protein
LCIKAYTKLHLLLVILWVRENHLNCLSFSVTTTSKRKKHCIVNTNFDWSDEIGDRWRINEWQQNANYEFLNIMLLNFSQSSSFPRNFNYGWPSTRRESVQQTSFFKRNLVVSKHTTHYTSSLHYVLQQIEVVLKLHKPVGY